MVKPVESGCGAGRPADAPLAAGTWAQPFTSLALPKPMAPIAAAADAGIEISLTKLVAAVRALPECDWRVLETAGGIAVPIDPCGSDWADFARALKVDYIVCVVDDRLGAINQARMVARYCQSKGLLLANVGIWLNAPDGSLIGANFQARADSRGTIGGISFTTDAELPLGVWSFAAEGVSSHKQAVGYFLLLGGALGRTEPAPQQGPPVPANVDARVDPAAGRAGTIFFLFTGLRCDEAIVVLSLVSKARPEPECA